tara:strand:+ start:549 stop:1382 length:834 start_codon:yes stop_codon:yes gene_type:complete
MPIEQPVRKGPDTIIQRDIFKEMGLITTQMTTDHPFFKNVEERMNEADWSQQGGLADGDGTFTDRSKYKKSARPSYKLKMKDLEPIQFLANLYGANISKTQFVSPKHKPNYIVNLYGVRAHHFMKKVCPYLIEKRKHVTNLINQQEAYTPVKIPMHLGNISLMMGYTVGFFDAEGCIIFKLLKTGQYRRVVDFTNTDIRPLKKIQRLLTTKPFSYKGVTIRSHQAKGKKKCYKLYIGAKHQTSFLSILEPFFQVGRKKEKIKRFQLYNRISKICDER